MTEEDFIKKIDINFRNRLLHSHNKALIFITAKI